MPRKKNPNSNPEGRPPTIIDWKEFDKLCAMQCTLNEIAAWFDCSDQTIENKCKEEKNISFLDYYRQKASLGKASLRRLQFINAQKGNTALQIWLGKNWLGQRDVVEHIGSEQNPIVLKYALEEKEKENDSKSVNSDD